MTAHRNGVEYERKIAAVYDGKVRGRSVRPLSKPFCYYTFGGFDAYKTMGVVFVCAGTYDLQLFSYFFAQLLKTLCGKYEVSSENGENPRLFCDA